MLHPWRALPAVLLLFTFAACEDDETREPKAATTSSTTTVGTTGGSDAQGAGGEGGGPVGPCQVLTPLATSLDFYSSAIFGVSAPVDLPLEGYAKTRLVLELYPSDGAFPSPGSYDLSVTPDNDYGTCAHCVLLIAFDELGQGRRAFFQESGTMNVTKYDADVGGVAAGEVSDVRLIEVTQNPDGSWNLIPDGLCFDVPAWSFDTTPVDGGPCQTGEDCPNEASQICDVETQTCKQAECSVFGDPPFCDPGSRCLSQYGALIDREEAGPAIGACYGVCSPGAPGTPGDCDAGSTCFALDATQTSGICLSTGGPAIGESCALSDVGTGCAQGGLCTGEPPTCHAICDYLTDDSGCASGTYCSALNLCEPLDVGDITPIGQLCEPGAATQTDCGPEGDAFRGLCFRLFESEEDAVCERVCRTADPDCPEGLSCIGVFTNANVGICADPGTCGDGNLNLLGAEVCDDGNTQSGDGCSGDCMTPELGALCSMASTLIPGETVVDNNVGGVTGYVSLCNPFIANPSKTYSFMPSAPGELMLRLTSLPDLGVSVLGDCVDPNSELECRNNLGDDVLYINFPTVPAQPALVVVRGATPLETGIFVLQSEFVVASCGDGLLGGPEACDDGNTAGGDGCTADCSAIEWPAVCASLPAIQDGDVVEGDLDDGSTFFDLTSFCSYESGRDRAYSFVAPSDGTLVIDVEAQDNLSIYVRDACGPIDETTFVACGNFSSSPGTIETATAFLQAGQAVTVVVDGFTREDSGPFTMTVSFGP